MKYLFVLMCLILAVSCNGDVNNNINILQNTPGAPSSNYGIPDWDVEEAISDLVKVELDLSAMTSEEIQDLRSITVYSDGEVVHKTNAEDLDMLLSNASKGIDDKKLEVHLKEGKQKVKVESESISCAKAELDEVELDIIKGTKCVIPVVVERKSSILFVPKVMLPGNALFKVSIMKDGIRYASGSFPPSGNSLFEIHEGITDVPMDFDLNVELVFADDEFKEIYEATYELIYDPVIKIVPGSNKRYEVIIDVKDTDVPMKFGEIEYIFDNKGKYNYIHHFCLGVTIGDKPLYSENLEFWAPFNEMTIDKSVVVKCPVGNIRGLNSSSNCNSDDIAERIGPMNYYNGVLNEGDRKTINITTSSALGENAWIKYHLPAIDMDILTELKRVDIFFGENRIGGWSDEYIESQLSHENTFIMPITPGIGEIKAVFNYGDDESVPIILDPNAHWIKTEEYHKYEVFFRVIEKKDLDDYKPNHPNAGQGHR